ncbi:hypothetical protein CKO28_03325 [Rhodovibrio sodomensis]|uniref:Carboxymuconolactone decarboxylase-like domain-containing protein n=1 Tax=Rhodovibrio sodomensis TaxID=1088 RepID=A0ABS1DAX2_9PROT|nr:carboxymuconolactone decarboxylase family protein [Rhodovibrio sodomensis]MBK1667076.1 hypothetical protein [Rhodovibrio sodomensis]
MTTTNRNGFPIHDKQSAPAGSQETLDKIAQGFGFVPNVLGVMAESPAALQGYATLNGLLEQQSAFTSEELQVLLLAISAYNKCGYCVAAHTGNAERAGARSEAVQALRDGGTPRDPKLAALVTFSRTLIEKQGWASESDVQAFLDAGFTRQHVLDTVTALAMKTLSNFTNHLADTPLDGPLQAKAWEKAA